jgi:hypothetical protein
VGLFRPSLQALTSTFDDGAITTGAVWAHAAVVAAYRLSHSPASASRYLSGGFRAGPVALNLCCREAG